MSSIIVRIYPLAWSIITIGWEDGSKARLILDSSSQLAEQPHAQPHVSSEQGGRHAGDRPLHAPHHNLWLMCREAL